MNWTVELSEEAERQLQRIPRKQQQQLANSITAMEGDPFTGNVKALQGEDWKGVYRKRAGRYRIIFTINTIPRRISVAAILLRTEKTYKR